jgi:cytochrome c556
MQFNKKHILISVVLSATLSGTALAQFAKPEAAIKYRQSALAVMANHFARIGAVVKGEVPYNKETVAQDANIVNTLAHLPWQAFGPGTEGGSALPAIWSDGAKFKAHQEKFVTAVASLNSAAQSGDLDAIKKTFGAAGQTCKTCHEDFKKK